jgi:hypothetical protein
MPVDKLVMLSRFVCTEFRSFAERSGKPRGGYSSYVNLLESDWELPALLFCNGRHNGIHKIEIIGVARLGRARTLQIAKRILGKLDRARIYRIDLCVDLLGTSAWQLAMACRIPRVQNFKMFRSRRGISYYPRCSHEQTILIYDRLALLRITGDPLVCLCFQGDSLTRLEIQLKGKGVPFRRLSQLCRYADIDPLKNVKFMEFRMSKDLNPIQLLAAERLHGMIAEIGLQATSKRFSAGDWVLLKKLLFDVQEEAMPRLRSLMRMSIRDWLDDRLRFPRGSLTRERT